MNAWLRRRAHAVRERMDDPDCDPRRLRATYAQFALVNGALAGWRRVFRRWIRPCAPGGASLLDVGCGGGDVARGLARWSSAAGVPLRVTACDPDARALAYARSAPGARVRYLQSTMAELLDSGERFDFVISNHVLHHLEEGAVAAFLDHSAALARRRVIHNDLRRSDLAYLAFAAVSWPLPGSYIAEDGLRSVRRAYTPAELRVLAPAGWRLERLEPFRTLLVLDR